MGGGEHHPKGRDQKRHHPKEEGEKHTVRRFAGAALPTPGLPVLAGALGEAVDPSALSFLVRRAVEDRKREEEKERKKKEAQEKANLELAKRDLWWAQHLADKKAKLERSGIPSSTSSSSKRKRKKRSKRKLPKSSSGVRIRRCGQGFRSRSSFSGAQCSLLLTMGPRCSTSWPVRNRRTVTCSSCARLVFLAILHLALCFLLCLQARDARHHGRYGAEGFFRHVQGLDCWYLTMSLALCSSWLSQAHDACHYGQHGPQDSYVEVHRCSSWTRSFTCPLVCYEWRHGPDSAENCLAIPQVQLIITVVDIFFVTQRQFSLIQTIQLTIEISLSFVFGGRCPCLQVPFSVVVLRQILWSRLSVGPFSSPVNTVGRCLCCAGRACHSCCCQRQVREAQTLQISIEVPQLLFIKFVDNSLL